MSEKGNTRGSQLTATRWVRKKLLLDRGRRINPSRYKVTSSQSTKIPRCCTNLPGSLWRPWLTPTTVLDLMRISNVSLRAAAYSILACVQACPKQGDLDS